MGQRVTIWNMSTYVGLVWSLSFNIHQYLSGIKATLVVKNKNHKDMVRLDYVFKIQTPSMSRIGRTFVIIQGTRETSVNWPRFMTWASKLLSWNLEWQWSSRYTFANQTKWNNSQSNQTTKTDCGVGSAHKQVVYLSIFTVTNYIYIR